MNTDRIVGAAKEFGGKAEAAVANVAGNAGSELQGHVRQAQGAVQNALGQAQDAVRGAAEEVGDFAQDAYQRGDRAVRRAAQVAGEQVEESPVAALAIVAAVCFAFGYAVRAATAR